jgi:His/Glu/Gln/Arg/opine family amino acid ABC transporter permease subunit
MLSAEHFRLLLEGARITVQVTALAVAWGTVVAILLGVASLSSSRLVRFVVRVYVEVLRGVSAIILIIWIYYALPLFGVELTPMQAGVLAFGLNLSAYGTEIVRGSIQAIPRGRPRPRSRSTCRDPADLVGHPAPGDGRHVAAVRQPAHRGHEGLGARVADRTA